MSYSRYGCACPQCAADSDSSADPLHATWQAANVSPYPVVAWSYTGDYRIDTMVGGTDTRWNSNAAYGTPVTVSYSFMRSKPLYGGTDSEDAWGFSAFNSTQMTAVRQIFAKLQAELNINFQEVSDGAYSYGQIRFGNNYQAYSSGYAWLPNSGGDVSGDVWIDASTSGSLNPVAGNNAWATLVHEIGHALGLKHPGNYNAGTAAMSQPGNYLGTAEDNANYTVMSYYDAAGGQPRDWFGMYDLLALKQFYGSDASYGAGDSSYRYTDASGRVLGIVDDRAGTDTIDLSALTLAATVDMRPGAFSSVGRNVGGGGAVNNLSIDTTTVVENLVGTAYGDVVRGNDAANRMTLGAGNNSAEGAGGVDTAVYGGSRGSYSLKLGADAVRVTGNGVGDVLTGFERVEFADRKLAVDLGGNAGLVAKTLGAVFGADSVANADYVGIGLKLVDAGSSAGELMDYALKAALGAAPSDLAVVRLLHTQVAGRAPDAAETGSYLGLLQSGQYTQSSLGWMAANHELNALHIDLVGLSANGLAYA